MTHANWKVALRCTTKATKILVTSLGEDRLKANLDLSPSHPRALVTLLEGLSLWHGAPLRVAACADANARAYFEQILYGGGLWWPESPLVDFDIVEQRPHRQRLRGLGDFRQLRMVEGPR